MKKSLVIASAALALASSIQAQSLVAGFDFAANPDANFSDLGNGGATNDVTGAAPFGTFSISNNGSLTTIDPLGFSATDLTAGNVLFSSIRVAGVNDTFGAGGSLEASVIPGLANANGGSFDFSVSTGATGSNTFNDYRFGFAAGQQQAGVSTVAVSYSIDGGSNFIGEQGGLLIDATVANGGEAFDLDFSGFSANDVIFRVSFTDIDAGVLFDNIQVAATAVPEPSSFAALAGMLALGFVAIRRRRLA